MDHNLWGQLVPILPATLMALVALYNSLQASKKMQAEERALIAEAKESGAMGADSIASAARALIEPMRERITELEEEAKKNKASVLDLQSQLDEQAVEIALLRALNDEYRRGIEILMSQIVQLGEKPRYQPE